MDEWMGGLWVDDGGMEEQMERWKEEWMGDGGWVCREMD